MDHGVLLHKLDRFVLGDGFLEFLIKTYLIDRTQFVQYDGINSHTFTATSGVPQGWGSILFFMFIYDITKEKKD